VLSPTAQVRTWRGRRMTARDRTVRAARADAAHADAGRLRTDLRRRLRAVLPRTLWQSSVGSRRARWTGPSLALAAAALLPAAGIALAGLDDRTARADVIVVPGNTVAPDGTPSDRLRARLDAALELYRERQAPLVVVSGGTGVEGVDEAAAMARYLTAHGVPAEAVVQDPSGVDSEATARNTAALLRARGLRTALVATQYFHVPRMSAALERHGVDVVGSRHARYAEWRDAYSLAREVVAFAVYQVRG
jgi:uncharacterized SAM-binding protein YcdF (DUF218 family)